MPFREFPREVSVATEDAGWSVVLRSGLEGRYRPSSLQVNLVIAEFMNAKMMLYGIQLHIDY